MVYTLTMETYDKTEVFPNQENSPVFGRNFMKNKSMGGSISYISYRGQIPLQLFLSLDEFECEKYEYANHDKIVWKIY